MPGLKVAVANGNWSNPAIWSGGTLPQPGDIVASNNFTVTIDQNVNVGVITNAATGAVSLIPIMTGYTTPSGTASASSEYGNPYFAWKAFNGLDVAASDYWLTTNGAFASPQWLQYEFVSPQLVKAYSIKASNWSSNIPSAWEFQAWDGTSWVVLDSVSGITANSLNSAYVRSFANSTAYSRYRLFITAAVTPSSWVSIGELRLFDEVGYAVNAVAGGSFVLTDGISVVTTNTVDGFIQNTGSTLFTYNGTTSTSLSGTITTYLGYVASTYYLVNHTGSGTLNFVGDLILHGRNFYTNFNLTGAGTLNYTGNITIPFNQAEIRSRFLNLVGTLSTAYVTGNINTVTNITANSYAVFGTLNGRLYITGSLLMGLTPIISSGESSLLSIVGPISKDNVIGTIVEGSVAVARSSATAINLFSGPFICSRYGTMPIACVRMHLIPNAASYFEFRDETTNGAISPGAVAPATRLVSPGGAVDAPIPANVRSGISYASGTLLGTMAVPSPSNVANNVPVDNTVGTAVLDPNAIWSVPLASINTLNSIGRRVKNAATVETTGAQIESILNSL